MWRKALFVVVAWAVVTQGCAMRFNWPDHRVSVQLGSKPSDLEYALGVEFVRLHPCEAWGSFRVPMAYAHGGEAASDYLPLDLVFSGDAVKLGELQPFEGEYCELEVMIAPVAALEGSSMKMGSQTDTRRVSLFVPFDDPDFGDDSRHLAITITFDPDAWGTVPELAASKIRSTTTWAVRGS